MGASDLPGMYAQSPRACVTGKSRVPMLQLLCNTSRKVNSCNANTRITARFYLYRFDYGWVWLGRCNSYTMATRDLPDIYALAESRVAIV